MSARPRFSPLTILQYLWNGPRRVRQVLAEQGPTAASRTARSYSRALCLAALVIYFLLACALGFFQMSIHTLASNLAAQGPYVLAALAVVGLVDLGAILSAIWATGHGVMALFRPDESTGTALGAVAWGIGLAIFYAGVFAGLLGYT